MEGPSDQVCRHSQLSPRPDAARIDLIFRDASRGVAGSIPMAPARHLYPPVAPLAPLLPSAEPPNHPMRWRLQSLRWRADPSGPHAGIVRGLPAALTRSATSSAGTD